MFSKKDLAAAQMRIEKQLRLKINQLKEHPIETTFYKVLCSEIKSLSDDLLKISYELDKVDQNESNKRRLTL
jgi:hypothetical protein